MALFDALIDDLATRFRLGAQAEPLAGEALALILGAEGGIGGFIDLFKRAGLGDVAASWLGRTDAQPLATGDVQKALGDLVIDPIAHRLGIALPAAAAGVGYALPRLVGLLTPQGALPAALPAEVAAFLTPDAGHAPAGDDHGHGGLEVKQIRASETAPGWLWPAVGIAAVVGLGWAVWPILLPNHPPEPMTARSAAPAPPPALAAARTEAPKPAPGTALPSALTIADDNGVAVVSGAVHDDKTRGAILDALKGAFGASKIKGDVAVEPNRTDAPWLPNLRAALEALKVPGVSAAFEGETVAVGGAIVEADRETITASLKSLLGKNMTVGAISDAFARAEAGASARAATALGSLEAGSNGKDLVAALNEAVITAPYGKTALPASVQNLLDTVAANVKKLPPGTKLEVAGYTDNAGEPNADLILSEERADAVRDALVKAGVPSEALSAKGYGGANPIAGNDTEEGRFRNRRIEFHVLKAPAASPVAATAATVAPSAGERANAANAKAEAALGALEAGAEAAKVVRALNLSVVNFASSSAEVPESAMGFLHHAAAMLKALPAGHAIEVAGYTDNTGDAAGNLVLSRERAQSVRAALIRAGAPEDMLTAKGYGAADPIESNDTEEGRLRNRRIEYHVVKTP